VAGKRATARIPLELRVLGGMGSALAPATTPIFGAAVGRSFGWSGFEPTVRLQYLQILSQERSTAEGDARFQPRSGR
jgi:hypothetical protein